jgi:putative ABC transport system permease protein
MLFFSNLGTAIEQLWANKLRSLLTVLGVIIAVTSTIIVVAMVQGFSAYITNFLQGLGTNSMWVFPERPPGYHMTTQGRAKLVKEDIEEVSRTCDAVARLSPLVIRQGQFKYRDVEVNAELMGCSEDFQHIRNFFVDKGLCFGPVDTEQRRQVVVIGRDLLRKLEADDGIIGQYITINRQRFRVIGLLERKGSFFGDSQDDRALIPWTTAVKMFPESRNYMAFMAQAGSTELVLEAKAQIINTLRRRHNLSSNQANDFRIQTQDEILREFGKISVIGGSVLFGIVAVSLLVGGIGIMNVMLVSVTERTREIGLRKAIGARRRDILMQFLTEAVVLSVVGGLIGVGIGYAVTVLASMHPSMINVEVPLWAVAVGVGFSAVVGVVFGLLPALKAAILQPIDALRYE